MTTPGTNLKKSITLPQLFSLAFGSIIGVGWITVMGGWLGQAGPAGAALAFLAGGAIMLMIGLCYAEMATAFPVAGGEVAYAHEVFGLRTSFLVGWFLVLGYTGVVVFEVISVGWVMEALIPELRGPVLYRVAGADVSLGGLSAGIIGMLLIAAVNIRGAKQASIFQARLVYGLLAVSILFAAFAFTRGDVANLKPYFMKTDAGAFLPGILAVLVTAPFWFSGFDVIPQAMGEKAGSASLQRIPLVMALAIGVAALFYCMVIFAASISLERSALLAADLPTADAIAAALGSDLGGKLVLFAGLLGLISSWNAFTYGASRVLFALGRAAIIFPAFGRVHPSRQTPTNAIVFLSLLGVIGAFFGRGAVGPVIDTGALGFACVFFIVCLCAIRYRRKTDPGRRVFTMPGDGPARFCSAVLALLVAGYAFYAPYAGAGGALPVEWIMLALWLGLGGMLYVFGASDRRILTAEDRRKRILTDMQ